MRARLTLLFVSVLMPLMAASGARAELDFRSRGELGTEARVFWPDGDERTDAGNVAVASRLRLDVEDGDFSGRARVFSRLDPYDRVRTLIIPEEVWIQGQGDALRLRVGFQMINWSATEAFHPADILNARILDGNFENPEKRGELIAGLRLDIPNGNVELMLMPLFTPPVWPSARSRLNLAAPGVTLGDDLILQRNGRLSENPLQLQWAVQVQQTWGNADVTLHLVQHIDRTIPLIVFDPMRGPRPVFQALTQVGATYQQVFSQLLVKLETAYRRYQQPDRGLTRYGPVPERDHLLTALGFEQALSGPQGAELSLLLEGQLFVPLVRDYPDLYVPLFEHDVLLGMRYAFNDEQSRSLLFTTIFDVVHPERLVVGAAYNQRLGDVWGLTLGLRILRFPPDPRAPVFWENLHDAHHLYVDLKRYF